MPVSCYSLISLVGSFRSEAVLATCIHPREICPYCNSATRTFGELPHPIL